jgi:hypothetical protein
MRVLTVNYLNPFTHPQATANMKNAVEALEVDFIQFKDGGMGDGGSSPKNVCQ